MERGSRQGFRLGLRVERVQGEWSLFEMTWAPDGRADVLNGRAGGHWKATHRVASSRRSQHPAMTQHLAHRR